MYIKLQVQNMICTANVSEDHVSILGEKAQMYTRFMVFFANILYYSVFIQLNNWFCKNVTSPTKVVFVDKQKIL